jgi:tetratricopeptide (TPR) repeat protein
MKTRVSQKPKKFLIALLIVILIFITLLLLAQRNFRIRNSLPIISHIVNYYDEYRLKRDILNDPSSARAHERLAWLYFNERELDKMEVEYKIALELNPKSLRSLYWLGHHYEAKMQFEEALNLYQAGAEADTTYSTPFYDDVGIMLKNLGRPTEALCAFEKAKAHPEAFNSIISGKEDVLRALDQNIDELRSQGHRCVSQIRNQE